MPGVIERAGATPPARAALFYGVCVYVRIGIAFAVMFAARADYTATIAVILAGAIVATITECFYREKVWWNRPVHAAMALGVATSAAVGLANKSNGAVYAISVILLADLAWGVTHSLIKWPFSC